MCYTISQQETSKKSKEKQELPCYTSSCSTSSFHPKFFPHNKIFPTPTAIQQGFFLNFSLNKSTSSAVFYTKALYFYMVLFYRQLKKTTTFTGIFYIKSML